MREATQAHRRGEADVHRGEPAVVVAGVNAKSGTGDTGGANRDVETASGDSSWAAREGSASAMLVTVAGDYRGELTTV